jgi:hypothetical protein
MIALSAQHMESLVTSGDANGCEASDSTRLSMCGPLHPIFIDSDLLLKVLTLVAVYVGHAMLLAFC